MRRNQFILFTLLFLFIISIFSGVTFAEDDRSYSIPYANIDIFIEENGNLHVKEKIHYSFSGTYNGIYRDIPLEKGQRIDNIKVSTQEAYSTYQITKKGDMQSIKVFLYSDPQKTIPITDRDVDVFIEYDFINVITIYNDIAELHYKLWGEKWEVDVDQLNSNIHVKSSNGIKYWLNPPYYAENSGWQGNILKITSGTINSGDFFEIRMAIPKGQFTANAPFAQKVNGNGLEKIEKIQQDYQDRLNLLSTLYSILSILMFLSLFMPLIIYFKFGREPKIDYKAEYERDLPTDDLPAVVNAISGRRLSKKVGEPDMDGFRATIMDLINRKYLIMQDIPSKLDENKDASFSLKINYDKGLNGLKNFESDVINFLRDFEENGVIYLDSLKHDLKDKDTAESFRDSYNLWSEDLKNEFLDDKTIEKIFIKKGDKYLKIFGVIGLIVAALVFYSTGGDPLPESALAFLMSILMGVVAIVSMFMPQKIAGRWTTYGEEFDAKWHNFARYIQDYSLIKEYPPESVQIWDKYLVYATALGIADKVKKTMEMSLPNDELSLSDIYLFHHYGGYVILSSSLDTGMSTASSGDSGDFGGVGGGSGGGGGGAF